MKKKIAFNSVKLRNLPIYFWLLCFVLIFFIGSFLLTGIFKAGLKAFNLTRGGLKESQLAISALHKQDISQANQSLENASLHFDEADETLRSSNQTLNILTSLPVLNNTTDLLKAGAYVTDAGTDLISIYDQLKNIQLNAQGIAIDGSINSTTQSVIDKNTDALNKIALANKIISEINPKLIPGKYKDLFNKTKEQLHSVESILTVSKDTFTAFKPLLTGKKTILLLLANDSELRPTGGFIGTYGLITVNEGVIANVHVTSIYDTDGQLTESINPPWPMLLVNGHWSLRDSNWFINYPDSAKIATVFFEKQGHATPDVVLTVTPKLFEDLLKISGNIDMQSYGLTINSENLLSILQEQTSVKYDKVTNQPKQLIADLFPILVQKFLAFSPNQFSDLLTVLYTNIAQKNIIMYSRIGELQNFAESYNVAGMVKNTDRDYLNINSANLHGSKSDRFISDKIFLESQIYSDGIKNTLTISRSNLAPATSSDPSLEFVRILVPKNSTLISAEGFSNVPIPTPFANITNLDSVKNWTKSQTKSEDNFVTIGEESGKTMFGGFLQVPAGTKKSVIVTYTENLPLAKIDNWSLLVQKQPGTLPKNIDYKLIFPGKKINYSNIPFSYGSQNSLNLNFDLDQDKFIGFVISNP